ncbi:MAG: FAD-dependent oxidoreductase [Chloroflexi bacterium]|nr:FAD-dependent oxidoreductase [Chloroflexota bacterium]
MSTHIVILGAGFGGLELSSRLSSALADDVRVTLIDKNEAFVFGFSKFDLMFGREGLEEMRSYYRDIIKPGVEFRRELVVSIDPGTRAVETDRGTYEADILVVALGADYNFSATPGFVESGQEFYSIDGALRLRELLPSFTSGAVIIGVLGEPFKCPPAPSEAAMLLDEWLTSRDVRSAVQISVVLPWDMPIPVSASASQAILDRFAERRITFVPNQVVTGLDPAKNVALLRDGTHLAYDLFLGVPVHRVPAVVEASGLAVDGWIPVDRGNLATRFRDVYAIGDVTSAPVPKAGMFAESAGRAVAEHLIAQIRDGVSPAPFDGAAACYIEFGDHKVGRVDADFLTGPSPTGPFTAPSLETAQEKKAHAATRRQRWFGG